MSEYRLPAALVEKMAEALKTWMVVNRPIFDEDELYSVDYEDMVAAVTGALLDECEVREEWGGRWIEGGEAWLLVDDKDTADVWLPKANPDVVRVHRLIITTPAEPVDPPLVAPFVRLEGPPGEEPG